jgi:hypothetical protein
MGNIEEVSPSGSTMISKYLRKLKRFDSTE